MSHNPPPPPITTNEQRCPSCQSALGPTCEMLGTSRLSFCPSCQFPLMLIAGKYQLQRKLANGGYGVVYMARHMNLTYEPERVIKFILPGLFEIKGMQSRFEREVQLTALLSQRNEHIVRIFDDFGEIPKLGHYYVMEYLQGQPMHRVASSEDEPMPLARIASFFLQLCDAMHTAHQLGVVHRDLKPQNLYVVAKDHEPDYLKVLDFGIAKPLHQGEMSDTSLTQGVLGTPAYMSPEQCTNGEIDGRSDIYSMGIILYEWLTGRTPFVPKGSDSRSTPVMQVLAAHISKKPPDPHRLVPHRVSKEMANVLGKALHKSPDHRFQSVGAFKQAFEQALHTVPVGLSGSTVSLVSLPSLPSGALEDDHALSCSALGYAETFDSGGAMEERSTSRELPGAGDGLLEHEQEAARRRLKGRFVWTGGGLVLCGFLFSIFFFSNIIRGERRAASDAALSTLAVAWQRKRPAAPGFAAQSSQRTMRKVVQKLVTRRPTSKPVPERMAIRVRPKVSARKVTKRLRPGREPAMHS